MPKLLALEWDDAELRLAVAEARAGRATLEHAFAVALPAEAKYNAKEIGARIARALAERGIRKPRTLVAVGRASIELKNLTVPPVPAEELPDIVRLQAEREFNRLDDNWPLDFLPIAGPAGEAQTVLAAAIAPELIAEIHATCEAAQLVPQRLILRPCAAASLLARAKPAIGDPLRLLVDLLADEADLTVLAGDAVVFLRTARLPAETLAADPLRALLPEVRRTLAAVHNRYPGRRVEQIFLCGDSANQHALARDIGRELELPAEAFDPLAACELSAELTRRKPEHPSRFAPLLGMLLDEADGRAHAFDFVNPRRRPEKQSRRREGVLALAAVAALVLFGVVAVWQKQRELDGDIARLAEQSKQLEAQVKQAAAIEKRAGEIEKWLTGDITWLDELARLSRTAPPPQELMLLNLRTATTQTGGELDIEGLVRSSGKVEELQAALRDERHAVSFPGTKQDTRNGKYGWSFSGNIKISDPVPAKAPQPRQVPQ